MADSYTVEILAVPGATGSSVFGLCELFDAANRLAGSGPRTDIPRYTTHIVSPDGHPVTCASGVTLPVTGAVGNTGAQALYIAPPTVANASEVPAQLANYRPVTEWLASHHRRFALIATHCFGSFVLAESGLLDGEHATTAWWLSAALARTYPDITVEGDALVVSAGRYVTGGGTHACLDVGLHLLAATSAEHFARLVAKYLMIDNRRQSQAPYRIRSLTDHADPLVEAATRWIRSNLARDFKVEDIARAVNTSPRTLIRRFRLNLGDSPQGFVQQLRIEKSKTLLETTRLPLNSIVQRCGYRDESAFRRLFNRYCNMSPREYRRKFNTSFQYGSQSP